MEDPHDEARQLTEALKRDKAGENSERKERERRWVEQQKKASSNAETKSQSVPKTEPATKAEAPKVQSAPEAKSELSDVKPARKVKIFVVFYSMYHHMYQLAEAARKGAEDAGAEAFIYQVAETLPQEVLEKMHAPTRPDVPIIEPSKLAEADGIIFGIPTRFGFACAQMKALFDATGSLWQSGALVGKIASIMTSTATQGGGQEGTPFTTMTNLVHHGMIYLPIGYTRPSEDSSESLFSMEIHGGSPWGAGTFSDGNGSRQPTKLELVVATHQGRLVATTTAQLVNGRLLA